ncbi:MAG: GNAT family N-acetyltransferase [Sphaerochaeta sp.]|nr:GNAT family N-acetyltransferase [Sphaerochaeta sp.]
MNMKPQVYQLEDMSELVIRSLEKSDAPQVVPYMTSMYAQSTFLARYSDEWKMSIEDEATFLESTEKAEKRLMLGGFLGHNLVALCDFSPVGSAYKIAHRCQMGISVAKIQQGKGIGSSLMESLLSCAKQTGFSQMELEVVATNNAAIKLYEKFGFRRVGTIPRGFRYREGYHADLLVMVKEL